MTAYRVPAPWAPRLRRQRLSPRETVVVTIFGTTTVEGESPSGRTVATPAASSGCFAAAAMSGRLDAVACAGTDAVTTVSGTLNGTSARVRTAPEFDSTSSSLTR